MVATWSHRDNTGIEITSEIEREFPAVFATTRDLKRTSERYEQYSSAEIIEAFTNQGLKLVELAQQRSSKRSPQHTQHVMRFQATTAPTAFGINDSVPEIVVMNSHDGKGSFGAWLGLFRFICANGMVVADSLMARVQRRHFGEPNTFERVMAVLAEMPAQVEAVSGRILDWSGLMLNQAQQAELATLLMEARPSVPTWALDRPELVLEARRVEEQPANNGQRSLWHTFNVLQENLTQHQIERPEGVEVPGARQPGRSSPMRPIRGAAGAVAFNRAIWSEAQAYFEQIAEGLTDAEKAEFRKLRKRSLDRAYQHTRRHGTDAAGVLVRNGILTDA